MRARCVRCWRYIRPVTFPTLCRKHRNQHGGFVGGGQVGKRYTIAYMDGTVIEKKAK